jgi:hypothetical protein
VSGALCAALLGLTLAAPASAQSLYTAPTVAPLSITSDAPGTRFEIQRLSDLVPLAKCVDECRVLLPVDQYRLVVHGSDGVASGRRMFELDAPMRMRLTPDAPWQRWTGLSMAVVGTAAILGGMFLVLTGSYSDYGPSQRENRQTVGGLMVLGGVSLSIPGWVVFRNSFRPGLKVLPDRR